GNWLETGYDAYDRVTSIFKTKDLPDQPPEEGCDPMFGCEYDRSETETKAIVYNLLSQPTSETTTYRYRGRLWDEDRHKPITISHMQTQHKVSYEYDAGGFLS